MSKKLIALLLVLTLIGTLGFSQAFAATLVGSSDRGDGTYTNPVIWADVPDQDVIRVGNAFYMSSTTMHMNPGVPIMKSYDLVNWETVSYCYQIMDDRDSTTLKNNQSMYGNGTWASSLRYKNGTFYLVVPSPTTNRTYIFQTEDPENQPWRRYEISTRYHDCSLLLDDDGRNWLVYGANPLNIIEINDTVTGIKEGATPRVILQNIHAPDPITGVTPTSGLAEGAHIQKIDGKYYIFCITWPSGKPRTEVCHRGDSLNGPFEAKVVAQEDIIIGGQGGGPAQGSIVDDGNGNWYGVIFRDSGSVGRIPWVMPIHWSNGWPMFGDDDTGMHLTRSGPKPIQGSFELKSVVYSDEFDNNAKKPVYYDAVLNPSLPEYAYNGSNLNLAWQWNHNPDNRFWSLTERPGWLRLTTGQMATNLLNARNTLTQRTVGPTSSVQTALDVTNMKNGDRAGLALFTARYGTLEVRMDNDTKTLVMVNSSSTSSHTDIASIPLTTGKIYLKVDADFRNQTDKGTFYYSFDGENWAQLGNTQQMAYAINNHFMGYRFALYNFATTTLGGYVDFDYFRISDQLTGSNIDTTLKDLQVNGTQVSGFSPGTYIYNIAVPAGAVPQVSATANDTGAIVTVTQAPAVPGQATVTVSNKGFQSAYTINFSADLSLKDLQVDGIQVNGFSPAKYKYSITVAAGSPVPQVSATPNDPNATVAVTQATAIPGKATVTVSSGGTQTATYIITVRYPTIGGGNVAWYKFDEANGATAIDSSYSGNDATIIGAAGDRAEGRYGNALQLQSASSQYVQLPEGIVSDLDDFTITTWINPATMATWARIFDIGKDTDTNMFLTLRAGTNNRPRFAIKVNGASEQQLTAGSGFTLSTSSWYHIAITKSGNTANMYLNGELAATNTSMTLKPSDMGVTVNNWIGRSQWPDPYLNGMVDEFSIYDYALSADEIKALIITGVTLDKTTLSLEEGSTATLTATIAPANAVNQTVTFSSSNTAVATVTGAEYDPSTGTTSVAVSAVAAGTATITAASADRSKTAVCEVTVTPPVGPKAPTALLTADSSVQPGSSFDVGVSLNNLEQSVYAEDITLTYDTDVFEYVNAAGGNANIQIARSYSDAAGTLRIIAANIGGVTGASSPVLKVTLKVKNGVQNASGIIAVTKAKLGVAPQGTVVTAAVSSKTISVGGSPSVDKTALSAAISDAETLYAGAVVGNEPGQYPQAAKDAFNAAIQAAKAVKDDPSAAQAQVDSAETALETAVDTFKAAVVKELSADINTDGSTDVGDLAIAAYYYGKDATSEDWAAAKAADINLDGKVDISDLAYVATKIQD